MNHTQQIEEFFSNLAFDPFIFVAIVWGVVLLTLLIIAIFTAVVASKKGRNGFGWFLIGLFTGVFGLAVALAILPKRYYSPEEDEL